MPYYESVFIARQDIPATQVEALTTSFSEIITAHGGKVAKVEQWGLRSLAYRIRKNKKGHYVLLNLDAMPDAVAEMERNMRLNEDILRFMTIKVEELEAGPSIMMRRDEREGSGERGVRGDRGDRGDRQHRSERAPRAPREAVVEE